MGLAILGPGFSTYAVSRADFLLAREFGLVASMHVTGKMLVPDGFERLAAEDALAAAWPNLVHANLITDETLSLLIDHGASFTVTPEVEMQMGFGKPLTNRLVARGVPVSLGSDIESAASSDMFAVARFALQSARLVDCIEAVEQTGKARDTVAYTASDAFRWATMDGARMVRLDHKIGSLTPGKAADVVVLKTDHLAPVHDPHAAIVLHAGPRDVETVLIAGEFRKRDGRLLAANRESVRTAVERSGRRIAGARQRRAPGRR
jgi:cytosine/adenosine deaminase-related metal-dependent hydrolase